MISGRQDANYADAQTRYADLYSKAWLNTVGEGHKRGVDRTIATDVDRFVSRWRSQARRTLGIASL